MPARVNEHAASVEMGPVGTTPTALEGVFDPVQAIEQTRLAIAASGEYRQSLLAFREALEAGVPLDEFRQMEAATAEAPEPAVEAPTIEPARMSQFIDTMSHATQTTVHQVARFAGFAGRTLVRAAVTGARASRGFGRLAAHSTAVTVRAGMELDRSMIRAGHWMTGNDPMERAIARAARRSLAASPKYRHELMPDRIHWGRKAAVLTAAAGLFGAGVAVLPHALQTLRETPSVTEGAKAAAPAAEPMLESGLDTAVKVVRFVTNNPDLGPPSAAEILTAPVPTDDGCATALAKQNQAEAAIFNAFITNRPQLRKDAATWQQRADDATTNLYRAGTRALSVTEIGSRRTFRFTNSSRVVLAAQNTRAATAQVIHSLTENPQTIVCDTTPRGLKNAKQEQGTSVPTAVLAQLVAAH